MLSTEEAGYAELAEATRMQLLSFGKSLGLGSFDLLLVGDGSGTDYRRSAGWSCIAYDRLLKKAVIHAGAVTTMTINVAELYPYIHALWFHEQERKGKEPRPYQVVIATDSEITARCGNRQYERRANGCFWSAVDWFEYRGYVLRWQHVRRLSNVWNRFADALAGEMRSAMVGYRSEIQDTAKAYSFAVKDD